MSTGDALDPGIRSLFQDLAHAGSLPDSSAPPAVGAAGEEALGTRVRFELAGRNGCIAAVRFRAYGCPYTLATCEWLSRSLEGRPAAAPGLGGPLEWAGTLGIPPDRLGRLLVIEDAIQAALTQL